MDERQPEARSGKARRRTVVLRFGTGETLPVELSPFTREQRRRIRRLRDWERRSGGNLVIGRLDPQGSED